MALLDPLSLQQLEFLPASSNQRKCRFSVSGQHLATVGDSRLSVWSTPTRQHVATLSAGATYGEATCCEWSPTDSSVFVAGYRSGTVCLWDATTQQHTIALQIPAASIQGCAYAPNGDSLATAMTDGSDRRWDQRTGTVVQQFANPYKRAGETATSCCFTPDAGTALAGTFSDGRVVVWCVRTGRELCSWPGHNDGAAQCLFGPLGPKLAVATGKGAVSIFAPKFEGENNDFRDSAAGRKR